MARLYDRVGVQVTTTGTGTASLGAAILDSANGNLQTFATAGAVNGEIINYLITDSAAWELGTGTYASSGPTITRTLKSSSSGALLNLSGSAKLYCAPFATDLRPIASVKTAAWTVAATDYLTFFVASITADCVVTLPAGSTVGAGFSFQIKHVGTSFILTLTPSGSDTIDTATILAKEECEVIWDGVQWRVFGLQSRTLVIPTTAFSTSTNVSFMFPTGYTAFDLDIQDVLTSASTYLFGRFSQDGGSTWVTSYKYGGIYYSSAVTGNADTTVTSILMTSTLTAANNWPGVSVNRITPGQTSPAIKPVLLQTCSDRHPTYGQMAFLYSYSCESGGRITNMQLGPWDAATISGNYRLWGIR